MAKGEIVIKDTMCFGCGYCQKFCTRGCIIIRGDKFTAQGFLLPDFINPDDCTACGICEQMCPHFAIEVYKLVESDTVKPG